MHPNSLEAYAEERPKLDKRSQLIYDVIRYRPIASTDREVAELLCFTDMNSVRPRISELVKRGLLAECGSTKDKTTGKTVRCVRAKEPNGNTQS